MNPYIILFSVALTTIILRFLPFIVFKEIPEWTRKLNESLPKAIMIVLVIFCMKDINVVIFPYGLPYIISSLTVIIIHLYKRNVLLSILIGTAVYMFLIQGVFI